MHTFVVRVFVADDVAGLDGLLEEPRTGLRRPFHGGADLVACLQSLSGIGRGALADPASPVTPGREPAVDGRTDGGTKP